ncbi:MAG TPA: hypothetical protein VKH42_04925 [Vicinamibacterales bacterium]|nr:hypothetical protein [Vicinamibacterales bacterium]
MTLLAVIVGALIVPVGYALSTDSTPTRSHAPVIVHASANRTAAVAVATPLVAHPPASPLRGLPTVPDSAKLLIVGASLFGLAAAVRKVH